jgi:hypothetical protein
MMEHSLHTQELLGHLADPTYYDMEPPAPYMGNSMGWVPVFRSLYGDEPGELELEVKLRVRSTQEEIRLRQAEKRLQDILNWVKDK